MNMINKDTVADDGFTIPVLLLRHAQKYRRAVPAYKGK